MAASEGGAVSYERGIPVVPASPQLPQAVGDSVRPYPYQSSTFSL